MYTVIEGMFVWYKLHTNVILWDSSGLKFMYISFWVLRLFCMIYTYRWNICHGFKVAQLTYQQNTWNNDWYSAKCRTACKVKHCKCALPATIKRFSLLIRSNDILHCGVMLFHTVSWINLHFRWSDKWAVDTWICWIVDIKKLNRCKKCLISLFTTSLYLFLCHHVCWTSSTSKPSSVLSDESVSFGTLAENKRKVKVNILTQIRDGFYMNIRTKHIVQLLATKYVTKKS